MSAEVQFRPDRKINFAKTCRKSGPWETGRLELFSRWCCGQDRINRDQDVIKAREDEDKAKTFGVRDQDKAETLKK